MAAVRKKDAEPAGVRIDEEGLFQLPDGLSIERKHAISAVMPLSDYQQEQLDALLLVRRYLSALAPDRHSALQRQISPYLGYRRRLDGFLDAHFSTLCTRACYESRLSACCTREGIVAFFAEVVINALVSSDSALELLADRLGRPHEGFKCVFLGEQGCLWRVRPIVCALFLCDAAERQVLFPSPVLRRQWQALCQEARNFRWPDRPVLFDDLERRFLDAGLRSSLMYLHFSPGLLRVKRRAGRLPARGEGA